MPACRWSFDSQVVYSFIWSQQTSCQRSDAYSTQRMPAAHIDAMPKFRTCFPCHHILWDILMVMLEQGRLKLQAMRQLSLPPDRQGPGVRQPWQKPSIPSTQTWVACRAFSLSSRLETGQLQPLPCRCSLGHGYASCISHLLDSSSTCTY